MRFKEELKFAGDASEVWKRASSVEDIPSYWRGTRFLDVVEKEGGKIRVKVKFAFGGSGEAVVFVDDGRRTMTIEYVSGPFTGKQTVSVDNGTLMASWDVKFRGIFRLASRWNESHFKSGTTHALERLAGGESGSKEA